MRKFHCKDPSATLGMTGKDRDKGELYMDGLLSKHFEYRNNGLHVEGVSLTRLAAEVGTPAYIYSRAEIVDQVKALQKAFDDVLPQGRSPRFFYACKANSNINLLRMLNGLGVCLETVAVGEMKRGLKAGFKGSDMLVTGVGKRDDEIRTYLEHDIYSLNVESVPELERINRIAGEMGKTARVMLRLNPNVEGGAYDKISTGRAHDKFGLSEPTILANYERDDLTNIKFIGISMHIGSQIETTQSYLTGYQVIANLVQQLRDKGHHVETLDIGGGFGIQYRDESLLDLKRVAETVRDVIEPLGTEIIMEPGRYIAGNAGLLLSRVEYVKVEGNRNFLILDSGMSDLIRPTLYDAYHAMASVANPDATPTTYDIVGPICETGDTFAKARVLPKMAEGDLCVIQSAGAYTASMASNYNTRPMLPEILVDGDDYKIIRRRQTLDDIFALEIDE